MLEMLILIHSFYSRECCTERDCRPVPCSEITSVKDGWRWKDKVYFSKSMLRVSPDGECHICVGERPWCVYLPPAT